jgi:hypothetical protein
MTFHSRYLCFLLIIAMRTFKVFFHIHCYDNLKAHILGLLHTSVHHKFDVLCFKLLLQLVFTVLLPVLIDLYQFLCKCMPLCIIHTSLLFLTHSWQKCYSQVLGLKLYIAFMTQIFLIPSWLFLLFLVICFCFLKFIYALQVWTSDFVGSWNATSLSCRIWPQTEFIPNWWWMCVWKVIKMNNLL